jgi:hypothetical protein
VAKIPFVGDAYTSRSANFASARTVNYYIEVGGGKDSSILIGCPGLTAPWLTLTGGGMRGMFGVDDSTSIMVCGGSVYKVTTSAGTTLIGSIPDDDRPVQIVGSGQDILITSANNLYALTLTGSSSTLLLTDIGMVDLLDDHFVANKNTTNQYVWSDAVTTVSPTYAREIQTPAHGFGMDGVLRDHVDKLTGILNGVDYSVWNPEVDHYLPATYSARDLSGKRLAKRSLLAEMGLPADEARPLLSIVARFASQKGLDLVTAITPWLAAQDEAGEVRARVRVEPGFKLTPVSALAWIDKNFATPGQ